VSPKTRLLGSVVVFIARGNRADHSALGKTESAMESGWLAT